ncbi:Uncharacterised protein [Mycobacteroides abscessus]|nr:Uncharacterised protein [Mycobacteroides abscessus]
MCGCPRGGVVVATIYMLYVIALIESPQVCSPKFLTCEQRSV